MPVKKDSVKQKIKNVDKPDSTELNGFNSFYGKSPVSGQVYLGLTPGLMRM
ncbi:hypothetical protein [Dyadobacter sp. 3J3]|uniref:hypothetical protein n=1 Tax=Dyadobacter sp. 3J3 TaxID=2606600 RepID=UPI001359BB50|nr:hypothetical protein [Dyadobacter sp. 3J3]